METEITVEPRDDVTKEAAMYQELQGQLTELKDGRSRLLNEVATLTATMEHANILKEKLAHPGLTKSGKNGVQCSVPKGNKEPCQRPGFLEFGLFCGTHKQQATSAGCVTAFAVLQGANFAQKISTANETGNQAAARAKLENLHLLTHNAQLLASKKLDVTMKELEVVTEKLKAQKHVVRNMRGARVSLLYHLLDKNIGVKFSPRSGEFGMVGNDCRKTLRNHRVFLAVGPFLNICILLIHLLVKSFIQNHSE